jgi:hypothetical protein
MITIQQAQTANWTCCVLALVLLIVHLGLSLLYQRGHIDLVSCLVIVSILFVIARIVVNTILLGHVTAHDVLTLKLVGITPEEVKLASILSLVTRTIATAIYWLQVSILLELYSSIVAHIRWAKIMIRACWVSLSLTFVAVVLVTFLECHPFRLYWQLSPPPGDCTDAFIQLLLQGLSNIFLDLMVLVIAVPLLQHRNRKLSQNITVGILFCLGTLCMIITCVRISQVVKGQSTQASRSLWASVQLLLATFVANSPFIYGTARLLLLRWRQGPATNRSTCSVGVHQQRSHEETHYV